MKLKIHIKNSKSTSVENPLKQQFIYNLEGIIHTYIRQAIRLCYVEVTHGLENQSRAFLIPSGNNTHQKFKRPRIVLKPG